MLGLPSITPAGPRSRPWIGELPRERLDPLARHGKALLQVVIHEPVSRPAPLQSTGPQPVDTPHQPGSSRFVVDAVHHGPHGLHQIAGFVERFVQRSGGLGALWPRRDSARTMTLTALCLHRSGRRSVKSSRAVTRRTHGNSGIAFFQKREVLTLLKSHERTGVASAARRREIPPVDRACGIHAVENALVCEERLERRRVAAVALLTAHVVSAVSRTIPVREMIGRGSVGPGEVAVCTPALLGCRRRREKNREIRVRRQATPNRVIASPRLALRSICPSSGQQRLDDRVELAGRHHAGMVQPHDPLSIEDHQRRGGGHAVQLVVLLRSPARLRRAGTRRYSSRTCAMCASSAAGVAGARFQRVAVPLRRRDDGKAGGVVPSSSVARIGALALALTAPVGPEKEHDDFSFERAQCSASAGRARSPSLAAPAQAALRGSAG